MASAPTAPQLRFVIKDLGDYTHQIGGEVRLGAQGTVELEPPIPLSPSQVDSADQRLATATSGIATAQWRHRLATKDI